MYAPSPKGAIFSLKLPVPCQFTTMCHMKHDWFDAEGNTPGDPGADWEWDEDSLETGNFVGYPLYLRLRDRLTTLQVPANAHDLIILEMINLHDANAIDGKTACATLMYTHRHNDSMMVDLSVLGPDECAPLTELM